MAYKQKHIACLGLSANPPHLGHFWIAKRVLKCADADEVWFIPSLDHPFKQNLWPWHHRWEMTKLMIKGQIGASPIESHLGVPSYTVQTIRALDKCFFGNYKFSWIIGSDVLLEIEKWKDFDWLKKNVKFFIVPRKDYPIKKHAVMLDDFEIIPSGYSKARLISSTEIRERLKKGLSIKGLVAKEVEEYIEKWFDKKTQKWKIVS